MESLDRIKEMGERYDVSITQLEELRARLALLKANKTNYNTLLDYYSQDWAGDYEASNLPDFPREANHAILSQDAIFDLVSDYQSLAIEMIEVALSYLK
ncbi:DUF4298 domain-containing protein [Streptococcus moroccensis]|uniref:DUF4298 domain-containing protein n=1 Tax=Streptococcus moroccensis TaxID=1451356 RepID=A0ABT9YQX3_9STRE|nr:DUF4298 domain-containing protein [Streptococcus moroccensis]MDQ0222398.1 hypothetical protein [Streptococcus moroccensis]